MFDYTVQRLSVVYTWHIMQSTQTTKHTIVKCISSFFNSCAAFSFFLPLVLTHHSNLHFVYKKANECSTSEMTSVRLPDVCAMVYIPWFNTTDNDLTCVIKEQEKCVLRRLSRRKCHLLVAENIWLRQEKVTWKKLILHLRGWCRACKDFFFSLCRQKLWKMPEAWQTKLFKR